MNVLNIKDLTLVPGMPKRISNQATVQYMEPYIGELFSANNTISYFNIEDATATVTGDLVTFVMDHIGKEYLREHAGTYQVRVKFDSGVILEDNTEFKCVTKNPYLINGKAKFTISAYKVTGRKEIDMSHYDPEALELLNA